MSVTVSQTCDGCGSSRELRAGYRGQSRTFGAAAEVGGWREVRLGAHLCPACIAKALPSTADTTPEGHASHYSGPMHPGAREDCRVCPPADTTPEGEQ